MEILKLKNPHLTKIVLVLTGMMTVMAGALIAPTLPSIQSYFSSVPSIELITPLVLTVVSLACIIFAPVIGYLLDRISKRKIFLTSLLLFAASGSAGLYLNSVWAIVASRVILGLAVAGISACTLTLVGDYFEGSERNELIGIVTAFMSMGGMIFVPLSGYLTQFNWHLPFALYLFPLFILPLAFISIPDLKIKSITTGKINSQVPAKDKTLKKTVVILIYALGFCSMAFLYIMTVQIPYYIKALAIGTSFISGIVIAVLCLFETVSSVIYGKTSIKPINVVAYFFFLESIGFLILSIASNLWTFIGGAILVGSGIGLMVPATNTLITVNTPAKSRGKYVGGLVTLFYLGQFSSPFLVRPLITSSGYSAPNGLFAILGVLCMVFFILNLIIFLIISNRKDKNYFFIESSN